MVGAVSLLACDTSAMVTGTILSVDGVYVAQELRLSSTASRGLLCDERFFT